ncbi:hypothetical protein [Amycolatopsis sp. DSM 110486]|uniref:hypothetical protein n=1 Tax=Amycolatopsis sp. DSM 110486 TaxID=2865832 RepID=UPI001C6A6186|nr:hypothetical protein [Amycolatopsis sp. DSM 110486]QYN22896.1 hypothetical protein K1T34_10765 [Amycolatopsis sp. DSM 110486]
MTDPVPAEIATALGNAAPPGWAEIVLTVSATVVANDFALQVRMRDGSPGSMELPAPAKAAFRALRDEMYEPGRGTWFSAKVVLRPDSSPEFTYDLDGDPNWWPPLHPSAFTRDLEAYPRDDEHVPAWLRKLLDEGGEQDRLRAQE